MEFRVWAPDVDTVDVLVGGQRWSLSSAAGGWWCADIPDVGHGADYTFSLDGGQPLPDPRSPWQPCGIHGPSRVVDHNTFAWHDSDWQAPPLESGIIYELHVGTFTPGGTFDSAIERLDHLLGLDVTHIELMPVNEFPGARGWGYDGVDLYAPHHAYGGPDGLKRFVDACHVRGLAVLLDVVYNHLGPDGNYLGQFGPYFTDRYATPWGPAVNLDGPGSDEVRRFFCDNALMWLRDYHFDGLRIDAVHAFLDTSSLHFLEQIAAEVAGLRQRTGRSLVLIAESDLNDPRLLRAPEIGGYGLDAQWSDDFHHALHVVLTGEKLGYYSDFGSLADLVAALQRVFVYDGRYSAHRQRRHGRPPTGLSGHRFVVSIQNHDQVGNRAKGERISHLVSPGRAKIAAALVFTSSCVPLLFQGEEWSASAPFLYFTDHQNKDLARAVSEGRRREFVSFGWVPEEVPDPQDLRTFQRSILNWDERSRPPHAELLDWYRQLIRIRRSTPALRDGRLEHVRVRFDQPAGWLVVQRGPITIACNLGGREAAVPIDECAACRILAASDPDIQLECETVRLPSDSVALLIREASP